jgi:hypothetical protein
MILCLLLKINLAERHLDDMMFGHYAVWSTLCLVNNMLGQNFVWSTLSLVNMMFGQHYVWST